MTLVQRERSSLANSLISDRLWHVTGPFRYEFGRYWRAGRIKVRSFEVAERVVARFNRRMGQWAEKKIDRSRALTVSE